MSAPLLQVDQVGKRFGGFVALDSVDLQVGAGERVGLIGPNGSGKSTLVNCICGTLRNETGEVVFAGEAVNGLATHERTRRGLARSFQLPRPFMSLSIAENIRVPLLYTVAARGGAHLTHGELEARCRELLKLVALDGKAAQYPRDLEIVWTVGLRGRYDRPFWRDTPNGPTTSEGKARLIREAVDRQIAIVRKGWTKLYRSAGGFAKGRAEAERLRPYGIAFDLLDPPALADGLAVVAAAEADVFPVDAQMTARLPSSTALLIATVIPLSLNEQVGFNPSSFR